MTDKQKLERILKGLQQDRETAAAFNDRAMVAYYNGMIASVELALKQ